MKTTGIKNKKEKKMEEIRKKVLNCIKHNSWAKRDYKIFYSNWRKHYPRNIIRQDYLKWHNQQEKEQKL